MPSASPPKELNQDVLGDYSHLKIKIHAVLLAIVWVIGVAYMGTHLKRGWVPHDEGALGMSAERVLNGELPNRDFDDYTGGLTLIHALAFRTLGINSGSMRVVLFIFFVAWVPAVYYVALHFGPPYASGAITLLSIAWSVPNYPGPMPSWYNLFFATFGVAAILRYLDVGSHRWLFLAGMCGGLSALAKITAAYFIAGVFLFFIFREQSTTNNECNGSTVRARGYGVGVAMTLAIFLALLFHVIHKRPGTSELVFFVLPSLFLVSLLLAREYAGIAGTNRERLTRLAGMGLPFGLGISIPIIGFLVPYVLSGSVRDLIIGLIAKPERALHFASLAPEHPVMMVTIAPFVLPVLVAYECRRVGRAICGGLLVSFGCIIFSLSARHPIVYDVGWYSLAAAIPSLVLAGAAILWVSGRRRNLTDLRQQQIMLLMCVMALCSIVQFPFSFGVYFLYVAPLVILFATSLFASVARPPRLALGVLTSFYLLFAVLRVTPGFIDHMGNGYSPDTQTERLTVPRAGGLRVQPDVARLYDELIPLVQSHAQGRFMYAAPDCPQVYFLSGLASPSRHDYDFGEEPEGRTQRTLHRLADLSVNVVTINKEPQFSGPMPLDLENALEQRFPHFSDLGQFQVRWKE